MLKTQLRNNFHHSSMRGKLLSCFLIPLKRSVSLFSERTFHSVVWENGSHRIVPESHRPLCGSNLEIDVGPRLILGKSGAIFLKPCFIYLPRAEPHEQSRQITMVRLWNQRPRGLARNDIACLDPRINLLLRWWSTSIVELSSWF